MQDLRKENFELKNLPYDADLNHLEENKHRDAFLETFSCFLLANEAYFSASKYISGIMQQLHKDNPLT